MAEGLRVEGQVVGEEVILLTIRFGSEFLFKGGASMRLSKELTGRYREIRKQWKERAINVSCVVDIQTEVAGSPLVRALFELWREVVEKESGQVICVNYPQEYIDSLTSLGLPSLPGFSLAGDKEEAIQKLKKLRRA